MKIGKRTGLIKAMTLSPTTLEQALIVPEYPVWRLTVEQYHQMIVAGILTDGEPIELLEGWLITQMTKNPRHSLVNQLLNDTLLPTIPAGYFLNVQEPITTADSEPEPDISVVHGRRRDYANHHPYPQNVALVIEVADTTLMRDRTLKLRIYANARIPVYWIVNLPESQIEVCKTPLGSGSDATYQERTIYGLDTSAPVEIDGRIVTHLNVRELLG